MASPTRDEAEALFAALSEAWDAGDVEGVEARSTSPVGELDEYEEDNGRPLAVEAVFPIDDREATVVVRSSLGGLVGLDLFRGRDGRVRVDLQGMMRGNPRDAGVDLAAFEARHRPRPKVRTRSGRVWIAPPEPVPTVESLRYLGLDRATSSDAEIATLEAAIGAALPDGYAAYVKRFGESCDSTFVRVYPPQRVLDAREEWRERIDRYWLWAASEDGFDRDVAYDAYVLADTLDGDEIAWHPARPVSFYVLPRNHAEVIARSMSFEAVLAWAVSSGDLGARAAFRLVAPLRDRVRVDLGYEDDVDVDAILRALTALGDGVESHRGDEDANVIWAAHGLEVFASEEPYVGLSHEPNTDPAFVSRVVDALASCGHPRV